MYSFFWYKRPQLNHRSSVELRSHLFILKQRFKCVLSDANGQQSSGKIVCWHKIPPESWMRRGKNLATLISSKAGLAGQVVKGPFSGGGHIFFEVFFASAYFCILLHTTSQVIIVQAGWCMKGEGAMQVSPLIAPSPHSPWRPPPTPPTTTHYICPKIHKVKFFWCQTSCSTATVLCSCNQEVCKRASVISQFDNPIEWESKKCFTYKSNETLSFF